MLCISSVKKLEMNWIIIATHFWADRNFPAFSSLEELPRSWKNSNRLWWRRNPRKGRRRVPSDLNSLMPICLSELTSKEWATYYNLSLSLALCLLCLRSRRYLPLFFGDTSHTWPLTAFLEASSGKESSSFSSVQAGVTSKLKSILLISPHSLDE